MDLSNWFTQGVSVNVVTVLLTATSAALCKLWKMRKQRSPVANPTITVTINKRKALEILVCIVLLLMNTFVFFTAPPAENRLQMLLLGLSLAGMLLTGGYLVWEFGAWRARRQHARSLLE